MNIDLAALPDDVETLQRLVRTLAAERTSLREANAEIERLNLIIRRRCFDRYFRLTSVAPSSVDVPRVSGIIK